VRDVPLAVAVKLDCPRADADVMVASLSLLETLLALATPTESPLLLHGFTTLYSRCHKGSAVKRTCVHVMAHVRYVVHM
jgi:hypothetical protein